MTTLAQLAELVGGTLVGDGHLAIHRASTLEDARAGDVTLIDDADKAMQLAATSATAAIVPAGVTVGKMAVVQVPDVHEAFTAVVALFRPPRPRASVGISPAALVHPGARIAAGVEVHAGATVADDVEIDAGSVVHAGVHIMAGTRIAEDVTIYPNCVVYEDTIIGPRVVIHGGAIIGAFGFGYKMVDGRHRRCAQLGNVRIEADVEIGAGTTIDRGTYGSTTIGDGTKIDNLVQIAHNCRIGRHNIICSQVGIAGSTTTGDYVVMGGQVGIRDHVHIGARATLGAMSGVMSDVPEGKQMLGIPATPLRDQMVKQAALGKLSEMRRQLKALRAEVERLSGHASETRNAAA